MTRRRRILKVATLVVGVLVLLVGLAWVFRAPLFGPLIQRTIEGQLAAKVGGTWEVGTIGGSWISDVEIDGVRQLEAGETGMVRKADIERLGARYSIWGLLVQGKGLGAIESVDLDNARLEVEPGRAPASEEEEAEASGALPNLGKPPAPFEMPDVQVTGRIGIQLEDTRLDVGRLVARTVAPHALEVEISDVAVGDDDPTPVEGALRGRLEQAPSGALAWRSETSLAGLGLPTAIWHADGRVDATLETGGGGIEAVLNEGILTLSAPGIDLEQLPAWIRELVPADVPMPLGGQIAAEATVRNADGGADLAGFGAEFDVQLRDLRWKTHTLSKLVAKGETTASGVIELETVEIEAEGSHVTLKDVRVDPSLPTFLLSAERIQAEIPDLAHWLPDLETPVSFRMDAKGEDATTLVLRTFEVKAPWGQANGKGRLGLPGTPERWQETTFDLELTLDATAPADRIEQLVGSVAGTAKAKGNLDDLVLTLDLEGRGAEVSGVPVDGLAARAVVHWPRAELETLSLRSPVAEASGHATLLLEPSLEVPEITLKGEAPDLAILARHLGQEDLELGGRASFDLEGRIPASLEPHFVLRADLTDVTKEGERLVDSARLEAALDAKQVALETLEAKGTWGEAKAEGAFDLTSKVFELTRLDASGEWGRAAATATVDLDARRAEIATLEAQAGETEVRLGAPLDVSFADDKIEARGLDVRIGDGRLEADLGADLEGKTATLERLSWTAPGNEDTAETVARLLDPLVVHWTDDMEVRVPALHLLLPGDVTIETSLEARVKEQEAVVPSLLAKGSFGEASLTRPLRIALDDSLLSVQDFALRLDDLTASAELHVDIDAMRAVVPALQVKKGDIEAKLTQPLVLRQTEKGYTLEDLQLVLGDAAAALTGSATWEDGLTADLALQGLELSDWVPDVSGTATATVELRGEEGRVEVHVAGLEWQHLQGQLDLVLTQTAQAGLVLETLSLEGPNDLVVRGNAATPFKLGTGGIERLEEREEHFALRGHVPLPEGIKAGPLRFGFEGNASGIKARLGVAGHWIEGEDTSDDLTLLLDITPDALDVRMEPRSNAALDVKGRIHVDRGFDWTRPETLEAFLDGNLSGRFVATLESWRPIGELVGGFRKLEGAAGIQASVSGTVRKPVPEVVARFENLYVAMDNALPAITALNGSLHYANRRLDIRGVKGELGYGPFQVSGHVALPEDGALEADVRLVGKYVLLARTAGIRVRADLDLALQGTWPDAVLRGNVDVADLTYTKPFSLPSGGGEDDAGGTSAKKPPSTIGIAIPGIESEPLASLKLDVGIRAKNNIRVRMNLLNADIDVDLRVGGTAGKPAPVGKISTEGATVYLPTTTLTVEGAEVAFLPGAPSRPRVTAMVRTISSGYDVGANAAGTLPNIELSVWSRPRLSDEDAMVMLLTGDMGGGLSGFAFEAIAGLVGDSLLSFAKGTADPETRPFFDRFSLTVGRYVSRRGQDTLEGEVRVAGKLHVYAERDRYDRSNLGFIWRVPLR